MDNFITPGDVALILNVSTKTVLRLIESGKLRAVHVAGNKRKTYRVYEHEIERYMAEEYDRIEKENE